VAVLDLGEVEDSLLRRIRVGVLLAVLVLFFRAMRDRMEVEGDRMEGVGCRLDRRYDRYEFILVLLLL